VTEGKVLGPVVDTHAHLDFGQFDADRQDVLARAKQAGVEWIINPGADLESSRRAAELAESSESVYAAVGIHPHYALTCTEECLALLRRLAVGPKVVAIGEIGLDYYRDLSPREQQRQAFRRQLRLAEELDLPVILHDRDAHDDILCILKERQNAAGQLSGVFHAFSGDFAAAKAALDLGFFIALGGPVTFQNARKLADLVPRLPLDRLLVETDSPYLAPAPHRGQRNEPAYVRLVVNRLAELTGYTVRKIESQTTLNAAALFRLDGRCSQFSSSS
jgi:TatD DNase family protein